MTDESFRTRLRRLRTERGLSLRQLNALSGVDKGELSRLENGLRHPTAVVASAVDNALQAEGSLIALERIERSQRRSDEVASGAMKRRALMGGAVAATVAGLLPIGDEPARRAGRIGRSDVAWLHSNMEHLYRLDYQHGSGVIWQTAATMAVSGSDMLERGTYDESVEIALLRATARMQMCAGWLAFDAGQQDAARTCYTEALTLAKQAGDAEVETHALSNLAFQANALGMPRQARRLGNAAADAASRPADNAYLSILPQLRLAVSHALSGDGAASDAAVATARRVYERVSDQPSPDWCSFIGQAELNSIEGSSALALGRNQRAVELLGRAVASHVGDKYARNRVSSRVRLARAQLALGDLDQAAASGNTALDEVDGSVTSWRVANELKAVARGLATHPAVPGAATFVDRYTLTLAN
jgi:transcriptional regulator with XRE-family HTH domain